MGKPPGGTSALLPSSRLAPCPHLLVWIPVEAADFLDVQLQVQGKVLVHCNLGVNRTVAVVTAFLMRHCGIPLEDAARQVCVTCRLG